MLRKIKPLTLVNVALAICLGTVLLASVTWGDSPAKTVYISHSTLEDSDWIYEIGPRERESISFDTRGYREVTIAAYLKGTGDVRMDIYFLVEQARVATLYEEFILPEGTPQYKTFSVKGSSLTIRFENLNWTVSAYDVLWSVYATT